MTVKAERVKQLPSALRKKWKGADVFVLSTNNVFIAQRIQKSPPRLLLDRMKEAGKKISTNDIRRAIQAARS